MDGSNEHPHKILYDDDDFYLSTEDDNIIRVYAIFSCDLCLELKILNKVSKNTF